MLLKRRPPAISTQNIEAAQGFDHLTADALGVLRWLNANKVGFVLVGPVARSIRGQGAMPGAVAIVPAPYGRNWERLCSALTAQRAGLRTEPAVADSGPAATGPAITGPAATAAPLKLTADKLASGRRWLLRCGTYDLDIEATITAREAANSGAPGERAPGYQELLYEATRFELAEGVAVEVAAPEDLEHYAHVRRTGTTPEFRVTRVTQPEPKTA